MRDGVLKFAKENGFQIEKRKDDAVIIVFANPNYEVRITLPFNVHEWFISIKETGSNKELFSDWEDHYHIAGEPKKNLDNEMEDSIINALTILNNADLRIRELEGIKILKWEFFKLTILEVRTKSGWVDFKGLN